MLPKENQINKNIVSAYRFAEISDVVFSGMFLTSQIESLNLKKDIQNNVEEHLINGEYTFIRKKSFQLNENDIIFCKTEFVGELFKVLRKKCNYKNIKLITHQSDLKITNRLYNSKPNCISKWYSSNVDNPKDDLIPIPLGIANFHSKNLNQTQFSNNLHPNDFFKEKENLLYLNFNINTNFGHRKDLYDKFSEFSWVSLNKTPVSLNDYKDKMQSHKFVLAPWGNGIDTHRFWEILYSGSIPVVKKHPIYESFTSVPKIIVNNYSEITDSFLLSEFSKLKSNINSFTLNDLNMDDWEKRIKFNKTNYSEYVEQEFVNNYFWVYGIYVDFSHRIKSKLKFFNRLRRYIYKKFKV